MLLAIDPGPEQSAYVMLSEPPAGYVICEKGKIPNQQLVDRMSDLTGVNCFAIEMVASYGMAVGATTFETVFWIGRFWQIAVQHKVQHMARLYRKQDVCMNLCHTTRAKDSNIRQALIDRFGDPGTKNNPGFLYGVTKDVWSALAVGVTYLDTYLLGSDKNTSMSRKSRHNGTDREDFVC